MLEKRTGCTNVCLNLLINANADVNARDINGSKPAMRTCLGDRLTCLQLLVDAEADLRVKHKAGLTLFIRRI
jgi:ankyrin repeat protein